MVAFGAIADNGGFWPEMVSPLMTQSGHRSYHLAHPDLADRIGNVMALRGQDINLPQLRDNLLRLLPFPRHIGPP